MAVAVAVDTGFDVAVGTDSGLVVSLTGASLVAMMDNFTPGPFTDELTAAGVPQELHGWLSRYGVGSLVVKMGIKFLELGPERTVATMPVEGNTQVAGILHGGAHVVLAETLGSFAAALHAGAGRHVVGIEVGATHHRSIASGLVTGTCTAIHLGGTLATHEIVMTDEHGRRLSTARITNMIRENRAR
ncbi:hotdog fold thioesterase [Arthrobacter gyeryongensis]|uniref:Hotdog fold thioesterase n=2 Tax=Arthrobacter gyeryongensis TaxID=1650592 RepID=A0ABP9SRW8_9MICC